VFIRSLGTAGVGAIAKALGLVNQIVSVTLISGALGLDGLQQQLLAVSAVTWFSLTLCGMHTSLPVLLIRAHDRPAAFAATAFSAFLLAILGSAVSLGLTLCILANGWIGGLAAAPVVTAAICNAAAVALSLSERVFQATDRIAEFNLLNMAGTVFSLAVTFVLARIHGTAADFIVAYYLGMLFPALIATMRIAGVPYRAVRPSIEELWRRARELVGVGFFGLGNEVAAFCKLQAPLALLGVLDVTADIAPVGLGLRLVALVSGGLSIILPILLLRIGVAIQMRDQAAKRFWNGIGFACAATVAVGATGSWIIFGQAIYRVWTGGVVTLHPSVQLSLAVFSALFLMQNLLFPLAAPDPVIARRLRWLFWLEGPAVLIASAIGLHAAPAIYGGAAMLAGAAAVMAATLVVLLVCLLLPKRISDAEK
jgi:hypothetical protein